MFRLDCLVSSHTCKHTKHTFIPQHLSPSHSRSHFLSFISLSLSPSLSLSLFPTLSLLVPLSGSHSLLFLSPSPSLSLSLSLFPIHSHFSLSRPHPPSSLSLSLLLSPSRLSQRRPHDKCTLIVNSPTEGKGERERE